MEFSRSYAATDMRWLVGFICGVFLVPHIIAKAHNFDRSVRFFDDIGLRPSRVFVLATLTMEILAAGLLTTGLSVRVGAVIAMFILAGAALATVKIHGFKWRWQQPGVEYLCFWASICLCLALPA